LNGKTGSVNSSRPKGSFGAPAGFGLVAVADDAQVAARSSGQGSVRANQAVQNGIRHDRRQRPAGFLGRADLHILLTDEKTIEASSSARDLATRGDTFAPEGTAGYAALFAIERRDEYGRGPDSEDIARVVEGRS